MRTLAFTTVATLALVLTAALFAQPPSNTPSNTKDIMIKMAIPASNALFAVGEKPSAAEWTEYKKQAQILIDAAKLLQQPGMMASGPTTKPSEAKKGAANPAGWNKAAKAMGDAGTTAMKAIDKKDADAMTIDVAGEILDSCSGCHDQYMIK